MSVTIPANKSCFSHAVLFDETLKSELQQGPLPVALKLLSNTQIPEMAHRYQAQEDSPVSFRMKPKIVSGNTDILFKNLLVIAWGDLNYQGLARAVINRVQYHNLPDKFKAEVPKETYHRMSVFDYRNIAALASHPESKQKAVDIIKFLKSTDNLNKDTLGKSLILVDNNKIFVPRDARQELLRRLHMGHSGYQKTVQRFRNNFWWKNQKKKTDKKIED